MEVAERQTILAPGDMLGCYRIDSFLGQGGFGVTYIARDTMLDIQVVVKEYLPEKIAERVSQSTIQPRNAENITIFQRGLANFLKEARTLARFKHPNIVRVMSVFELNSTAYMVMEYERGHDLKLLFTRRQHVSEQALKAIVGPILDGLEEVHRHGFIHRDIKPANILVRDSGSPVLLDFGSARLAVGQSADTMTAMVTAGFAPLEQYSGLDEQQGPWTDIYALGAVLYFAVTGYAPLDSTLRGAAVLNDNDDPLVPLTVLAPEGYSPAFCRAVDWALQFKVSNRPQTPEQWRARLFSGETDDFMPAVSASLIADTHTTALPTDRRHTRPLSSDDVTVIQSVQPASHLTARPDDTFEFHADTQLISSHSDRGNNYRKRRVNRSLMRHRKALIGGLSLVGAAVLLSVQFWQPSAPVSQSNSGNKAAAAAIAPPAIAQSSSNTAVVGQTASTAQSANTQSASTTLPAGEVSGVGSESIDPASQQFLDSLRLEQIAEQAEKLRVAAAREAQRDIDREVQRTEARRLVQLREQAQAEADAAAAAERVRQAEVKRAAQRQVQRVRELDRQREAELEALKLSAIKPPISDGDMSMVLGRFDTLSTAIKQRNGDALREVTVQSDRKYAYFDYVFRTFDKVEVNVRNISASRQDQTIRATLHIERMIRSNGDIAIPPDEFRSIPIYSVKETQWSAIYW